jgi:hypothetical protein
LSSDVQRDHGWATAEVGGGNVKRLTVVREQMQKAFGV